MPTFWRDTGRYNDAVVSVSILCSMAVSIALAWPFDSMGPVLAAVLLGPLIGLLVGVLLIACLSAWFSKGG